MHGTPHKFPPLRTAIAAAAALVAVVALGTGALGAVGAAPASAAPGQTIGSFPTWSAPVTAQGVTTGSAIWSDAARFPTTTYTATAGSVSTASGASAFLGPGTGFAGVFGSSRLQPYLTISAPGSSSTTTFTFGGDQPTGWGFALGDVDVDYVTITGTTADGQTLTADDLGWQGGDVDTLNYCRSTPKPTTCGSGTTASYTDFPRWDPAGGTTEHTTSPTLIGTNRGNTSGAYGWFRPTRTDLRTLTFTYGVQSGIPNYQVWFAALAQAETISGTVAVPGAPAGTLAPPDTTVQLARVPASDDPNAGAPSPVLDVIGDPVTAPVAADGTYALVVEPGTYTVTVIPPAGSSAPDPATTPPIVVTDADVVAPTLGTPPVAPVESSSPTAAPPTSPSVATPVAADDLQEGPGFLAATGSNPTPAVVIAIVVIVAGLVAIEVGRRRRLRDGERPRTGRDEDDARR